MTKTLFSKIAQFTIAFLVSLSLIEVHLELSETSLPSPVYDDIHFGRSHKANSKIMQVSGEGFCMTKVNCFGYLGPGYPTTKADGTIRIALIGDSYVAGLQLFDRYHFRTLLEKQLSAATGQRIEVLNFGIGGIDFRGMYAIYKEKALRYQPDLVLFFVTKRDFQTKDRLPAPDIVLDGHSLKIDYSFSDSREFRLRRTFAPLRKFGIGTLLKEAYEFHKMGRTGAILLGKLCPATLSKTAETGRPSVLDKNDDPFYEVNEAILRDIASNRDTRNITSVIIETEPCPSYYNETIKACDLAVLDLGKEFSSQGDSGEQLKYWKATRKTGHWNHQGHYFVAKFLLANIPPLLAKPHGTIDQHGP